MTWKQETLDDIGELLDSLNGPQLRRLNKLNYTELLDLEQAIRIAIIKARVKKKEELLELGWVPPIDREIQDAT